MSQPSPLLAARQRALALLGSQDFVGARVVLEYAIEVGKRSFGEDDPDVLATLHQLARLHQGMDDLAAARRVLEEAYAAGQWRLGDSDPLMLEISFDLGLVAEELGNRHEARRAFGRVAGAGADVLGMDHWAVMRARAYLDGDPQSPVQRTAPVRQQEPIERASIDDSPIPHRASTRSPTEPTRPQDEQGTADPQPSIGPSWPLGTPRATDPHETPRPAAVQPTPRPAEPHAGVVSVPIVHAAVPGDGRGLATYDDQGTAASRPIGLGNLPPPPGETVWRSRALAEPTVVQPPVQRIGAGQLSPGVPVFPGSGGAPYRRRGVAVYSAIAASLAAVIAVVALVFVLANRRGAGADNVPTVSGAAPTDVRLADNGSSIRVTWGDPAGGRATFVITMARAGELLKPTGQVGPGKTSYTLDGLNAKLDYCFSVVAVYGTDRVGVSPQACTRRSATR